jgi:cell division septum initiation protein DivIVA
MTERETRAQELARLVSEYDTGERQHRAEAWNLIADFTVENWEAICAGLRHVDGEQVTETKP